MGKKLKLTKIELETKDGKKVSLSIEEAKDLHDQLHDLFGQNVQFIPSRPVIIERDHYPWRNPCAPYWRSSEPIPMLGNSGAPIPNPFTTICEVKCNSGLSVNYMGSEG